MEKNSHKRKKNRSYRAFNKTLSAFLSIVIVFALSNAEGMFIKAQASEPVNYIDHTVSGTGETAKAAANEKSCTDYVLLADTLINLGSAGQEKWYLLKENVTINTRMTVNGTVNLILKDGCILTANEGITVETGNTLNIFAESDSNGMGKLIVPAGDQDAHYAGIGGGSDGANCGMVNIHGGDIDVTGYKGAGIGGARGIGTDGGSCTSVIIYGGKVSAKARDAGVDAGIGGGGCTVNEPNGGDGGIVTIYGGSVSASSSGGAAIGGGGATNLGIKAGKGAVVTIYDGDVTAQSNGGGAGIGGGGGLAGEGNTVTIYGGKVTAETGHEHAIGYGGAACNDGDLILGPDVKLYGRDRLDEVEAVIIQKPDGTYDRKKFMTAIYKKTAPVNDDVSDQKNTKDDTDPKEESGDDDQGSYDYLDELRTKLKKAADSGTYQTVTWDKGTALPYDIMKLLEDNEKITLIFTYTYQGKDYKATIQGRNVKTDKNIPWYGPLYLNGHYGVNASKNTNIAPMATGGVYTVKKGDTLSAIARRLNTTVDYLVKVNNIVDRDKIREGQILKY